MHRLLKEHHRTYRRRGNQNDHICTSVFICFVLLTHLAALATLAFEFNKLSNTSNLSRCYRQSQIYSNKILGSSNLSPFHYESHPYKVIPQRLSFFDERTSCIRLNARTKGEDDSEKGRKNSQSRKETNKKKGKDDDTKGNFITRFFSKKNNSEKAGKNRSKEKKGKRNKRTEKRQMPLDNEVAIAAALGNPNLSDENVKGGNKDFRNTTALDSMEESNKLEFPNVFASVEENLKEVRDKFNEIRPGTTQPEEETKKLNELKVKMEKERIAKQKKEEIERKKQQKLALEKERQKLQKQMKRDKEMKEQIAREKKQKEQKKRQKAIMKAAKYKPRTNEKGLDTGPIDAGNKEKGDTKGNFDPRSIVTGGISNAQNFISNTWESVFGDDDDDAEWIVACPKTRISPGEVIPIVAGGLDLLLVASKDAKQLHVIANSCPHLGTPLETGPIERRPIETFQYGSANAAPAALTSIVAPPSSSSQPYKSKGANLPNGDGCEECIVCPLHQTAFALESGEVRGEWCPYPPVIGKVMGSVKPKSKLVTFEVRTRGKNIEVRLNTPLYKKDV